MNRFVVELGMGIDLHGGDVTKAARRAVQDAMSHSCLCGLSEILDIADAGNLHVNIKVGCPHPEEVDRDQLVKMLPFGRVCIDEVVAGGLSATGMHVDSLGEGDQIVVAVVALTVSIAETEAVGRN